MNPRLSDVVVVGAGAAGIGIAVTLKHAGIENFVVLDRVSVGASFESWPAETRFISPSFPTNSIGMLDLNSIALGVSPAFSLRVEHPTGEEFACHLRDVATHFELPIKTGVDVMGVTRQGHRFRIDTKAETYHAKHVIWAAGEFQYPRRSGFPGAELCRHTADDAQPSLLAMALSRCAVAGFMGHDPSILFASDADLRGDLYRRLVTSKTGSP